VHQLVVEQAKLMQEIVLHQAADQSYLDEGVRLIELAQSAQRLFAKQKPSEQRRMLNFVHRTRPGRTTSRLPTTF
jgi:site-specific DNA recombinase